MRTPAILLATVALVLFVTAHSPAQVDLKPAAGITYTDFSKDPSTGKFSGQVGYQIGATLEFGGQTFFEGGIFYATKGVEYQEASTSATFDQDLNGVRIPAMIGFNVLPAADASMIGLRLFGGGSAFIVTSVSAQDMTKDDFTSPTYGVFAGAGVDIGMFFVDAKYEWSLSDVSKLETVDVGQSRSLIATAGIRMPL